MRWTPPEPPDGDEDDSADEPSDETSEQSALEPDGPYMRANAVAFVVPEPILLRIERVETPGAAPGEQPVAITRAGPDGVLLAVNAYPAPLVDAFFASDAFGEPVIVVGAAWEEDGGVRGELSALLPERTMRAIQDTVSPEDEEDEAEPWAASATLGGTSYEEAVGEDEDDEEGDEDDDDAEPHFPLVIGAVLRFPENRKYPTDFELEVDDLMRSILEGRAMDARQKQIDNLLGGL